LLLPSLRLTQKPLLTDSVSLFKWDENLARRFSLTTRFGEPYSMFGRRGDYLELPRAVAPIADQDLRRQGTAIDCALKTPPRDQEQIDLAAEMTKLLLEGESFILCAGTGKGKTWYGASAIATVKRKTLVLVPKQDLMDQWRERLQTFLGLKPHELGIVQADKVSVVGKKVVLGMIHSVALQDRYPEGTFDDFGLVIVDEAHRAAADQLVRCFRNLPAVIRLALSATPKRADGKEQLLYAHIGPIRIESLTVPLVPKVLVFKTPWQVQRVRRRDPETGEVKFGPMQHSAGKVGHVISHMVRDTARNEMIGKLVGMAYAKGRKLVAFTDSLDHVEAMISEARKHGVPASDCARYVGGMSEAAREAAKVRPFIAATWGMFKEGTDVPWLDTALFATPRSDVRQGAGRVLREYPDKKQPLLLDLVDADSGVFRGYYQKRLAWYRSIGASVIES
jgi:superfamily II DNA or RNA helicase